MRHKVSSKLMHVNVYVCVLWKGRGGGVEGETEKERKFWHKPSNSEE